MNKKHFEPLLLSKKSYNIKKDFFSNILHDYEENIHVYVLYVIYCRRTLDGNLLVTVLLIRI